MTKKQQDAKDTVWESSQTTTPTTGKPTTNDCGIKDDAKLITTSHYWQSTGLGLQPLRSVDRKTKSARANDTTLLSNV
jgi:hypothetical protein